MGRGGGKGLRGGVGSSGDGEVQAAVGRKRCLDPGPLAFREPVRRGLCGCRAAGQRGSGFTLIVGVSPAPHPGRPDDSFVFPQALGLARLVGEAEEPEGEEEEEEGEGPLCPEKRFLRLSDGALLLRVLGIM